MYRTNAQSAPPRSAVRLYRLVWACLGLRVVDQSVAKNVAGVERFKPYQASSLQRSTAHNLTATRPSLLVASLPREYVRIVSDANRRQRIYPTDATTGACARRQMSWRSHAGASPSAVQSCPRRRAVGACDEPTDRRGGQLVSEAQDHRKPPTNRPEEPIFPSSWLRPWIRRRSSPPSFKACTPSLG